MTKRVFFHILFLGLMATTTAANAAVSINGLSYEFDNGNKTATLVYSGSYASLSGDIIIPDTITYNSVTYAVTAIHESCFKNCTNLTGVTIPKTITYIGSISFYGTALNRVDINDLSAWCRTKFGSDMGNPLCFAHHLYLDGEELTSLVVPDSISAISDQAFQGCTGLTSVTFPSSAISVGDWAFTDCSFITSVNIPSSNATIGDYAFQNCTNLTDLTVSSSTISFGYNVFNFTNLTNVIWSVKNCTLKNLPFEDLKKIKTVTFTENVEHIPASLCMGLYNLTTMTIPNSVTSIGEKAFYNCSGIRTINMGNSVTTIGKDAFYGCDRLYRVNTTDLSAWCNIDFKNDNANPLKWGSHNLYLNNTKVRHMVIPDDVTKIRNHAFCGSSILSVSFPNSVTSIGINTFRDCNYLSEIQLPDSMDSIGSDAFNGCTNLTSAILPNGLKAIGPRLFYGCEKLSEVTITASVSTIGQSTFSGCKSLSTVINLATTPQPIEDDVFSDVNTSDCELYVPTSAVSLYREADVWKTFNIQPIANVVNGDLNNDGSVNVGDVSELYSATLAGSTDSLYDLNNDGSVNVGDVSSLYRLILGQ